MESLPADIRNLPNYYVPKQFFICSTILLIFFLVWTLFMIVVWLYRSCNHIHNYQYIVDHNIRRQFQHAKQTYKIDMERQQEQEHEVLESQAGSSNPTKYTPDLELAQIKYNRLQSRILEFVCLSVVVAININAFSSTIMEIVTFFVAVVVFLAFNVFRIVDKQILRLLFFIPLVAAYLPFFIFEKHIIGA